MAASVTELIEADLARRILTNRDLPRSWSLPGLAGLYAASTTPVRAALDRLRERGLVVRAASGRVRPAPRMLGHAPDTPPAPSEPASAEERLRELVLDAVLLPEPGFLREEALAERLGVSRTVVRQRCGRLAGEGWLVHEPRRGWRPPTLDRCAVREYLEAREALEVEALALAYPRLDRAELARLRFLNLRPRRRDRVADNRLHRHWIDRSGNRFIRDFFDRHSPIFMAVLERAAITAAMAREMAGQHVEILDALLAGKPRKASAALAAHIRDQEAVFATALEVRRGV